MMCRPSVAKSIVTALVAVLAICDYAQADETLAKRSGCLECHNVDKKVIGPSFHDVAERYRNSPSARAALIEKVKTGGKGNWIQITGGVPMPPHSALLSDSEIQTLVDWVLSQ